MAGPLAGLKVIEMVGLGPCPFAAMMLADMGAEVIRIERKAAPAAAGAGTPEPHAPDPYAMLGTKYDVMARGRRSLALDLKNPRARLLLLDLVAKADVLVEGFRPGVMERLGLGPDVCLERNPRLVYRPRHRLGPDRAAGAGGRARPELRRAVRHAGRDGPAGQPAGAAVEPGRRLRRRRHDAGLRRGLARCWRRARPARARWSMPP